MMRDARPVPGACDGMGAFRGPHDTTILIRNHENRERPGEVPVVSPEPYDPTVRGGNTKLVVRRDRAGLTTDGQRAFTYTVEDEFTILGGTSTNCAGGVLPFKKWITCEEVVKGPTFGPAPAGPSALKHGYIFEIDATSDGPVPALPVLAAGRFAHEATVWRGGCCTKPRIGISRQTAARVSIAISRIAWSGNRRTSRTARDRSRPSN